ncbi:MAG: EamA family transporter [Ignavibacteriales bacterium]|nr:EamA family transporter [Ignavibacteriales bacterium]
MSLNTRIVAGLAAVTIIFGTSWMANKIVVESIPPITTAALRLLLGASCLFIGVKAQRLSIPRERSFYRAVGAIALLSFSIPFVLTNWGLRYVPSGLAAVMYATMPFWVALFSRMFVAKHSLNVWTKLSLVVGFLGVVIILGENVSLREVKSVWGILAVLTSTAIQAFSLIAVKIEGDRYSSTVMNFVAMAFSGIVLLVVSLLLEPGATVQLNQRVLLWLIYLSLFGNGIVFVVYFWLVKFVEPVLLSMVSFVTPVLAVAVGVFALNESLGLQVLIGAFFVLAGIVLANGPGLRRLLAGRQVVSQ